MDSEVNLIREYERIIKTMKEQIAVLKNKVASSSRPQRGGQNWDELQRKDTQLRAYSKQISDLSMEIDSLTENNRKLSTELRAYEYGINQATHLTRTQMQEKLLESELSRIKAQEEVQTLTELVREIRGERISMSGDFDRDVELYLQKKDDPNKTQNSRTASLQKRVHQLEDENKELRDRISVLEGEKRQVLERLHQESSRPSDEELAILVTRLRGELLEKERVICELQGKPLLRESVASPHAPKSVKTQLLGDIRKELGRALSPRSASLEQKMQRLKQSQGKRGQSVSPDSVGSAEFMANLSRNYETMMEKYEQRAIARGTSSKELSVIKEKLGTTGRQLIQIGNRPSSSQPRSVSHGKLLPERSSRFSHK